MAKQMRMIVAAGDVAGLIDRGSDVDIQLKNLSVEDKGIKAKIGEVTASSIEEGETSIRLRGTTAAAVVSAIEKIDINANAETFPAVQKAVEDGLLAGIVEKEQQLVIPPDQIEDAVACLRHNGFKSAMIAEAFKVNAEKFREMATNEVSSVEQGNARKALRDCVSKTVSFRVKYEKV